MLTCREMSELGSDIIDHRLTFKTRLGVLMHLSMCVRCRNYIKQLELTSNTLKKISIDDEYVDTDSILKSVRKPDA
ncbi:anti-sigma factor [Pseudomonas sp. DP16D-R1]|jgi:predicted anti-sigma-YlaC factor YlaD|nr:anti-sigma factor [Pseudomonas sp. DP16D-R1]